MKNSIPNKIQFGEGGGFKRLIMWFHDILALLVYKKITLPKILEKVVELVGGGSVINGAYPV